MAGNIINKIKFSPVDIAERRKLDFRAGDTVNISSRILDEKGKYRLQAFEGIVLARKHGREAGATFTVRKVASGVGVERIFPLYSPMIDKIEVTKKAHARRSKLYYIRTKAVKDVRSKMRSVTSQEEEIEVASARHADASHAGGEKTAE
ncbi:TPA: 50S ribosomal protein L19 [Candidatus Nomurabacteria bacterium]|uniref:50S ribosomal protein L19 n=2 Tax=Candidatus Nomuraibacteriota TaxID=1752729 RepID=A0A1F6YQ02_9BACT|nr:MAG: 50S ribosomal protein L19 [Parcubacteria group bacterium GW2011_GWC1_42_21]KKS58096.1 MAG: 50S ribosomal protein L19 [Candidatus Nomurabacteria bacterium GW2011_GWF1_42_40]KKS99515.1 MAG: 50S ribosomal protein L19 [Candidatus Nomurabacteria bacterium GW2011_GWA1_43_17]KKT06351.1 MAG: 50S ribosomal protein L19 [Candidatus Nomurabacteria bacterium GW2011_GWB1_43_19]KKT10547.1 MAG: 50S ribosomal protein L19 [Candidatus Nomurabacteria bacterium GW2011_GWF2_43_24]KKT17579.1 MAG: 50S ribosom